MTTNIKVNFRSEDLPKAEEVLHNLTSEGWEVVHVYKSTKTKGEDVTILNLEYSLTRNF